MKRNSHKRVVVFDHGFVCFNLKIKVFVASFLIYAFLLCMRQDMHLEIMLVVEWYEKALC